MGGSIQNVLNLMGGYVEINDTISCGTWQADTSWWGLPFYGNYMGDDPQDWVYADYFVLASSDPVFTANASGAYLTAAKEAGNSSMWGLATTRVLLNLKRGGSRFVLELIQRFGTASPTRW